MIQNKRIIVFITLMFIFIFSYCEKQSTEISQKVTQQNQEAKEKISQLLVEYSEKVTHEQYQLGLNKLEEILDICKKYSIPKDYILKIIDKKQFILQKLEKFDEALKLAFKIEEMSQEIGKKKSPWNYLKIADSYLGLKDKKNAIKWIEKAVNERGFKKYKVFQHDKYKSLLNESDFQKMMKQMRDSIGLDHPAKDFSVSGLDGKPFKLSDQKGLVVLIDFWNVDCLPCRKAIPELKKLYSKYKKKGFEIIGISIDTNEEKLQNFLNKKNIPWKNSCSYKGWKDKTVVFYGINATPSTWLIDRKGILRFYNLRGEKLKNAVEKLIKE